MHHFRGKMFQYSCYTYCVQEDSKHFGLEVSAQLELIVSNIHKNF